MEPKKLGLLIQWLVPDIEEKIKERIDSSDLMEREKHVLTERIFEDRTLESVAHDHGVTRERIRQIEAKAFRKLRHRMYNSTFVNDFDELTKRQSFHDYRAAFYDHLFDKEEETLPEEVKSGETYRIDRLKEISINDLDLSVRPYNVLRRNGIHNLYDLSQCTEDEVMSMRDMGRKSFGEVKDQVELVEEFSFKEN